MFPLVVDKWFKILGDLHPSQIQAALDYVESSDYKSNTFAPTVKEFREIASNSAINEKLSYRDWEKAWCRKKLGKWCNSLAALDLEQHFLDKQYKQYLNKQGEEL